MFPRIALISIISIATLELCLGAPASSSTATSAQSSATVPYASDDLNFPLWNPNSDIIHEPIRAPAGATILGPQNVPLELENPDSLAPPSSDNGDVPNFKWPFSLSHNRLADGGWARQQNNKQMPVATDLAGVNMRLKAGAVREMHWHATSEWAYVLKGDLRVSTITTEGEVYLGDVSAGDLWYFPPGQPHSIQAKNTTKDGAEFLLVFDSGSFSEDDTFLLTDWLAHVPKEVIAKNFQVDASAFDHIPSRELYIFPSVPPPDDAESDMVIPNNTPIPFTYALSKVNATQLSGGSLKVADSRTFKASTTICATEVTVQPGGLRELHWHPTEPEWTYFITGNARVTLFASQAAASTVDFQGGDIGYIPPSFGHYIENTGNTTLVFLEILKSSIFQDISLNQWLALTPPELVKAHLGLDDETISKLSKVKQYVVGPSAPGQ
ncbi:putative oxalate decarboxylase/oxidase [Athelia psychrophila]|uniref:Oxalate decarboxylase/oxidase n=1 Tax=Athelia psychrophila TaxID=1759441 RepID=A0A166WI54_9AGAM|nr:putative oxalate decarboxylase/oxidase [Fibularhizoctonia sp. CBS 109695]